jgi:hypothetical protein
MKRKLKQVSVAALAGAASMVFSSTGHAAITIVASNVGTETVNGGVTYDVIDFTLTGLSGNDALPNLAATPDTPAADPGVNLLAGTFSGSVANSLGVPGNATSSNNLNWTKFLNSTSLATGVGASGSQPTPGGTATNAASTQGIYDWSFVNLDGSPVSPARSNAGTGVSTTAAASHATAFTGGSTSFNANWDTTDTPLEPSSGPNPNPLIAQILVLHGDGVTFSGKYAGDDSATLESTTFSYSPLVTGSSSSTTGTNKIVSLLTTGSAPTAGSGPNGYGSSPLGTLTVTNAGGSGKYFPGYLNIPGGATTGYIAVKGFLPGDVPEVYALQVALGGVVLAPTDTRLATIIADIKANDDTNSISGAGITTVVGSPYASLFPGYDILVPSSVAGGSSPYFEFDFSSSGSDTTDGDAALGPVTVTSIAAVPEPATAAGVILGAAGLLLGRRKNRLQAV